LVIQTCIAPSSSEPPDAFEATSLAISMPSAVRLATMTSPARAVAAIRDHRLCRTIRRGFVAISAASSASSMIGMANRGPSSNYCGSSA
jgi:hypothetical protein